MTRSAQKTVDRVAIVAIHGVSDQAAGRTARDVARLLCHGGAREPRYVEAEIHDVLLPVARLTPDKASFPAAAAPASQGRRNEHGSRRRPGSPSGFYQARRAEALTGARDAARQDLGVALNDYLLGRPQPDDDGLYESSRISLVRRANGRPVDVFELYWADLSRLGHSRWRALSALYQLFFHLGTLAADVVDQISLSVDGGVGWRVVQRLHAWLAWLMKGPAALLQICMILLVLFGAAALVSSQQEGQLLAALCVAVAVGLTALGVLAWVRGRTPAARWVTLLGCLVAAAACATGAVYALRAATTLPVLHFATSALLVASVGGWLIERYSRVTRAVRLLGHVLVFGTVAALCLDGRAVLPSATTTAEWMLTAAFHVGEWLLAALLLVWAAYVIVQLIALVGSTWLGRRLEPAQKRSLNTARILVVASAALFAMLSLVLWSVVGYVASHWLRDFNYQPVLFGVGYRSGEIFLDDRIRAFGVFFTPLVALFALLASATGVVLGPSLLEELFPTSNTVGGAGRREVAAWSERLGAWLTRGQRWLERMFGAVVTPGAIIGGLVYLAFVGRQLVLWNPSAGELPAWLADGLDYFQGEPLVAAGKWLAGGAWTLAALGSRFTQGVGRLRVAIDAVLDVDNYFADPPDRQPPRARIYARYASLLVYLRDRGYARIIVVAHSQGSVIGAEMLRYLHVKARLAEVVGNTPIVLVTLGSPLRDVYAEHFPLLYRWMGPRVRDFARAAPRASDIGAVEWVNVCRSGDYIGRFLWNAPAHPYSVPVVGMDGKVDADRAGDRTEFCLGAGAHTHYFDADAGALALELDRLIEGL